MSPLEWFTALQTIVMTLATVIVWGLRRAAKQAVDQSEVVRRLDVTEAEIMRLRARSHAIATWQQTLLKELDDRYYTRREVLARQDHSDSPWPNNRKRSDED